MTVDDENSIYVGGLPYDATEDELRRHFDLYGAVVAVKLQIINDREVGGKCYGFVTFTNPRSAVDAISDMNGRTVRGRVVRVNEVRTRAGRPNFHRESFRRDAGRDVEWDGDNRDRDRDHVRDRDHYRDRNIERSRDRGREREKDYERGGLDIDRARDNPFDRDRGRSDHEREHSRDHDRDWERDREMEWEQDREVDKLKEPGTYRDGDKDQQSRNRLGGARLDDHRSREVSSDSSDGYHQQVKEELADSIQRRAELQQELVSIKEKVEEKEELVSDLEKKSQKLEDALVAAKKLTVQRQSMLTKLHRGFLQAQDYTEKLKSSEQELKELTDLTMAEVEIDEESGMRAKSMYANGKTWVDVIMCGAE